MTNLIARENADTINAEISNIIPDFGTEMYSWNFANDMIICLRFNRDEEVCRNLLKYDQLFKTVEECNAYRNSQLNQKVVEALGE